MYIPAKFKNHHNDSKPYIKLTPENIKTMAEDLLRYLIDLDLDMYVRIYFNFKDGHGTAIQSSPPFSSCDYQCITQVKGKNSYRYYILNDINPQDYFKYNGNYLSMSFEGPLYHILNYTAYRESRMERVNRQLNNYFSHYGLYMELGDAWNASVYE